ncbi:hypothetical protein RND71_020149 [Anisodus tanguticus]|uniref:Uncharacterized protein n=1 Tax=Anisodus tanguticus TaxID=243964 RepID=A0AAE1S0V9_9SOLA|nr:hypothetical protein RND71_020149 [Anisodus tanguticus]
MTLDQCPLSSYSNLSINRGIIIDNGNLIPIRGYGHANFSLPPHPHLVLKNTLHAPNLIKNLVYVRKFTTDNWVSVNVNPFGFSVKDFKTGIPLMRCNSRGDLYPITHVSSLSSQALPYTFAALAHSLWHARLGHPG